MKINRVIKSIVFSALAVYLLGGAVCKSTIAQYDQYAYTQATSIKVDALNTMTLASDDFTTHQKEVNDLNSEIQKIYEYDKNRPKNGITTKQWEILIDSSGNLLGGFLTKWKREGKQSAMFITEKKTQISAAFDQIIQLEIAKTKPTQ
jgi:hypothetical protein